jgi:SAM-dependent methyltransferase
MTIDEAVRQLRRDPDCADLVRDAYLGRDVADSQRRFAASAEFAAAIDLLGGSVRGRTVVDLGAGTGIAAAAFRAAGAGRVIAIEPDPSDEVGRGALIRGGVDAEVIDSVGEDLSLASTSVDIVYLRQVLHHASDLDGLVAEVARVLRPGGTFLACREHVVDDEAQLRDFLAAHPIHRLAGGENAFSLDRYQRAIAGAGLVLDRSIGHWESVINAFPTARSDAELATLPTTLPTISLTQRFGRIGSVAARLGPVRGWEWRRLAGPQPGRLYTFVAHRP